MAKLKVSRFNKPLVMRRRRVRAKMGQMRYPRLSVFRSNKYIYAQIVDIDGKTLTGLRGEDAAIVGTEVAKLATKNHIKRIVFDRGGYKYHGQVKILADAAREGGLDF